MQVRPMVVADAFYEGSRSACERAIERCLGGYSPPKGLGRVLGGVVPHAGWVYSGATAAKVFLTLRDYAQPSTIVIFGAVHQWGVSRPTVDVHDAWATPLGEVRVDAELAGMLAEQAGSDILRSAQAHASEHSIEVQLPFIKKLFPEAQIVPIAAPPGPAALAAAKHVAKAAASSSKQVVVVATTDLTHYGMHYGNHRHGRLPQALSWMKSNDQRMIRLIERLDAEAVLPEAEENANACGAGAVAAGVAAARELGAREARLLEYTTSADVMRDAAADSAVGYAALVFCAPPQT